LGLAIHFKGKLVTFDKGIKALISKDSRTNDHLEFIQV